MFHQAAVRSTSSGRDPPAAAGRSSPPATGLAQTAAHGATLPVAGRNLAHGAPGPEHRGRRGVRGVRGAEGAVPYLAVPGATSLVTM